MSGILSSVVMELKFCMKTWLSSLLIGEVRLTTAPRQPVYGQTHVLMSVAAPLQSGTPYLGPIIAVNVE